MKRYRWWHAALFYAGVQAGRVGLRLAAKAVAGRRHPDTRARDREFYRAENLPVFAPPPVAFPIAWTVNSVHDFTGLSSSSTVQAPQCVVSQPMCVPVSRRFSLMKWTRRSRDSTSAECGWPLTVIVIV